MQINKTTSDLNLVRSLLKLVTVCAQIKVVLFSIVVTRLGAVIYSMLFEVKTSAGERLSPLVSLSKLDTAFYLSASDKAWQPILNLFTVYNFNSLSAWIDQGPYSGPLFPWLLGATNYTGGSPYFMALGFLVLGMVGCGMWSLYLKRLGAKNLEQLIVVFYPVLIYFTLMVSTDLIFSIFFGGIFIILSLYPRGSLKFFIIVLVLCSICLTLRPNSLILLPILFYYLWCSKKNFSNYSFIIYGFIVVLLSLLSTIYYMPYFTRYYNDSGSWYYWGIPQEAYTVGIFGSLPYMFNLILSWLALASSKLLYLSGLRPSYSDAAFHIVMIRASGSVFLLPGMFYLMFKGRNNEKLVSIFFLVPLFLGVSQERYLLPLCPIFMFYGARFWLETYSHLAKKL
jgi:hypothetical protein